MEKNTLPREFAAIDLGSNSFHMVVARIVNGSIQILSRIKRRVRLADGLDQERMLSAEAIERGVDCLALFAKRLQGFSPENVKVVGTYTLRRAINNAEFLMRAKSVFPYPIEIISGQEEAKLIYAGVCHTQPEQGRKLIVDIGGGSTEIAIGDDFLPLRAESRHMGCVSFAKRFFPHGELSPIYFENAYKVAMEKIADLAWEYRQLGWQHVLGSSGTIKTVHLMLMANGYRDGIINESRLKLLIDTCLQFDSLKKIQFNGLLAERADVLVPGLAILLALFHTFKIEQMRYSSGALREGVMYGLEKTFQVNDIQQRTANAFVKQFNIDMAQAQRVRNTVLALFAQIPTKSWRAPERIDEFKMILKWASELYEVGMVINHDGVNRHSAYILENCNMPGFDYAQQELLVLLVRFHLGRFKEAELKRSYRYSKRDVITLLRLFRIAIILNRARQPIISTQKILLSVKFNHWHLIFDQQFFIQHPLIEQDLLDEKQHLSPLKFTFSINFSAMH